MRAVLLVLVTLMCFSAEAATKKKKRRSAKKKPQVTQPAPPASSPPKVEAPRPEATAKSEASKSDSWEILTAVALSAGGFYAGGMNRGPAVGATVTLNPRHFDRRFSWDLDLHWRMASFSAPIDGYGRLGSTMHSFPFVPALRVRAFTVGKLTFDVRGGVGPMVVFHQLSSDFGQNVTRSALGWEAFAAGQLRFPISTIEVTAEVRAGLGAAHVPLVLGQASGAQLLLGARYALP